MHINKKKYIYIVLFSQPDYSDKSPNIVHFVLFYLKPFLFYHSTSLGFVKTEQEALNFCTRKPEKEELKYFKVNQKYNFVDPDS